MTAGAVGTTDQNLLPAKAHCCPLFIFTHLLFKLQCLFLGLSSMQYSLRASHKHIRAKIGIYVRKKEDFCIALSKFKNPMKEVLHPRSNCTFPRHL